MAKSLHNSSIMIDMRTDQGNYRHGMTGTPIHGTWKKMKERCFNPNRKDFQHYGGRGITICERWMRFENFMEDMGIPDVGMSIERKDVNGNYCPENCVWIPKREQPRNRRSNVMLQAFGREMLQADWARFLGVKDHFIHQALKRGHTLEWFARRRGIGEDIGA